MDKSTCTWKKVNGRYICQATKCPHWLKGGGCKLGKASVTCDNNECKWNLGIGINKCSSMDLHLDADGRCLGVEK